MSEKGKEILSKVSLDKNHLTPILPRLSFTWCKVIWAVWFFFFYSCTLLLGQLSGGRCCLRPCLPSWNVLLIEPREGKMKNPAKRPSGRSPLSGPLPNLGSAGPRQSPSERNRPATELKRRRRNPPSVFYNQHLGEELEGGKGGAFFVLSSRVQMQLMWAAFCVTGVELLRAGSALGSLPANKTRPLAGRQARLWFDLKGTKTPRMDTTFQWKFLL